ncbi:hypothetical protein ILYODFUR_023552 [Ilyodon furcidens]|uniref:Uncharacterized protein n=1 Tax=Ilyodon furcidens TaxID=33524 RepID=A0ABV0UMK0_9TELE
MRKQNHFLKVLHPKTHYFDNNKRPIHPHKSLKYSFIVYYTDFHHNKCLVQYFQRTFVIFYFLDFFFVCMFFVLFLGLHSGTGASTVFLKQEVPGFKSQPEVFLYGVHTFSLCMSGFSPGTQISSHSPKT